MRKNLIEYLAELDSDATDIGVYVNPDDPVRDYIVDEVDRVLEDERVFIGTLEQLSFGNQDEAEVARSLINNQASIGVSNPYTESVVEKYLAGELPSQLEKSLSGSVELFKRHWSQTAAKFFVENHIPKG